MFVQLKQANKNAIITEIKLQSTNDRYCQSHSTRETTSLSYLFVNVYIDDVFLAYLRYALRRSQLIFSYWTLF